MSKKVQKRLLGRYGSAGCQKIRQYDDEELFQPVAGTHTLWAELFYAAEHEQIRHLSDLLLRRVRIGLLVPHGGIHLLDRIEKLCSPCLSWDNQRWTLEKKAYIKLWETSYAPPGERKS